VAQRALNTSEDALVQSTRNQATNLIALYKSPGWRVEREAIKNATD